MNTYQELKLNNGQTVKLTLNLKRLLNLKSKHSDLYNEANRIITKGASDISDLAMIVYIGYLCALDSGIEEMSYDTFTDLIPQGLAEIGTVAADLITAKKK